MKHTHTLTQRVNEDRVDFTRWPFRLVSCDNTLSWRFWCGAVKEKKEEIIRLHSILTSSAKYQQWSLLSENHWMMSLWFFRKLRVQKQAKMNILSFFLFQFLSFLQIKSGFASQTKFHHPFVQSIALASFYYARTTMMKMTLLCFLNQHTQIDWEMKKNIIRFPVYFITSSTTIFLLLLFLHPCSYNIIHNNSKDDIHIYPLRIL